MTEKEKTPIAGCLRGDKAAWDAFVLQYSRLAFSTIRSTLTLHHILPEDDIVEDLHQEFFLSLCEKDFRKLRQFKGERGCSLASWLRIIAVRLTIDFLRKQRPATVEVPEALATDQSNPPTILLGQEAERRVAAAIESLSPRDRLFVDLHFYRGLPPEEIATILRTSVPAIYTQKSRVLAKIREIMTGSGSL